MLAVIAAWSELHDLPSLFNDASGATSGHKASTMHWLKHQPLVALPTPAEHPPTHTARLQVLAPLA
jgi:hypothetical protein